MIDLNRTKLY